MISAAESKYSHHRAAASSIAATSAAQPPKLIGATNENASGRPMYPIIQATDSAGCIDCAERGVVTWER